MVSVVAIFYIFYFLYLFSLFVDWQFILNSQDAMWVIIIILFGLIFMICLVISVNIEGYNILNIRVVSLMLILCGLILLIGIAFYYQYYTENRIYHNIRVKVSHRDFTPINYQYGRDSQEIGMRLRVGDTEGIPRNESKTLQEIWEMLMTDRSNNKIGRLMRKILGSELNDSIDVSYNLLWYLCISEEPFRNNLTNKEISHVISANITELYEILGDRYNGASDRASLIFTILSGQIIPESTIQDDRYEQIKQYDTSIVYNLAFIQNKIIDHENGTYNIHGPYKYLSSQPPSLIEGIISNVINENFDELIERLGIGPINNLDNMTEDEKIAYIQGDLVSYSNVFTRDPNTEPPPDLLGFNPEQIYPTLLKYTNQELIEAYEPRGRWNSRIELIRLICKDATEGPKWSIHSVLNCNNDDTMNIMTGETHGDSNKHDLDDPTLSYGIQKNYRCYQASELEASFRDYDGIFMFRVPDWTRNAIDPITRNPLIREFPIESIKQLKSLLEKYNIPGVRGLMDKIQHGLDLLKSANMQTRNLKQRLSGFTFEQKQIIDLYLSWMFTYSMWMRFWKGPGHPWPLTKVNVRRESERNQAHRSSPQERDEYIFIQEGVRTTIIEMYEKDPQLKDWIESLPTIYYDFDTGEASCATHNIKGVLDQIALGEYCMGFGSDTILKTAYYYITHVLDHTQGHSFDEFIERMIPRLLDLEYTSITNQLNSVQTPGIRLQVLNSRLRLLSQPIPKQPPFNPSSYQNNVHID
jgi:hypothetical protein